MNPFKRKRRDLTPHIRQRFAQAAAAPIVKAGPSELGGGSPYGTTAAFPAMLGWRGTSDYQLEAHARRATTVAVCISRIAFDMATPDLIIEKKVGKRKWERLDEDSPEFGGVAPVFQKANPDEGKTTLWYKFHASFDTFGRSPLLTDYVNFGAPVARGTVPKYLRYLYAPNLVPQFDGRAPRPYLYRYSDPTTGGQRELRPDEVLFHLNPRLDDPWQGASTVAKALIFAAVEGALGTYWFGWFKNGARAGVVLESENKITPEQMRRLKAEWNEEHGNSMGQAFGTWFLHSGFKLKELAEGQKDADFGNLFRMTKEEIISAFHVPPVLVGDFSNAALANIEEQTPIYYEGCLMPRGKMFTENLTEIVGPRFDPSGQIRFRLDWESVPAMRRLALKRVISNVQATGVPYKMIDEIRALEGDEPLPNKKGQELYIPFSVSPIGITADPRPEPAPADTPPPPQKGLTIRKWIDSAERNAKRVRHESSMGRFIPSADRELRAFFTNQEQRVLSKLPEMVKETSGGWIVKKEDDGGWDDEFESDVTKDVLVRIYSRVASVRGAEAMTEIGERADKFLMDAPEVQSFLRENGYKMGRLITETTGAAIKDVLAEAFANGETLSEITTRIRDLYAVRRSDAMRIARTEVSRSYNFSTLESWDQSGAVEGTEWLTAHDAAVRESHADIDGTTAPLGEQFDNGCKYPGDPDAPADETINCRCTTLPVLKAQGERVIVSPAVKAFFAKNR